MFLPCITQFIEGVHSAYPPRLPPPLSDGDGGDKSPVPRLQPVLSFVFQSCTWEEPREG